MAKLGDIPTERAIIPPTHGWKTSAYYTVSVSFAPGNPIHKAIFYTGFLNKGIPTGYNTLFNASYEQLYTISDVYYMRAIEEIKGMRGA